MADFGVWVVMAAVLRARTLPELSFMSVKNCMFPWHWLIVTHEGDLLPCGHGSKPVGNLREQSAEEIWNGPVMQGLRASLLAGEVHAVCRSTDCPYQQEHLAFTPVEARAEIEGDTDRKSVV